MSAPAPQQAYHAGVALEPVQKIQQVRVASNPDPRACRMPGGNEMFRHGRRYDQWTPRALGSSRQQSTDTLRLAERAGGLLYLLKRAPVCTPRSVRAHCGWQSLLPGACSPSLGGELTSGCKPITCDEYDEDNGVDMEYCFSREQRPACNAM